MKSVKIIALAALAAFALPASADPVASGATMPLGPTPPVSATTAQPQHALTEADLSAWLDGMIPLAIGRGDIAGAEVVVVKDGHVLVEKGYGVADVKTGKPVDPARTLFRPGLDLQALHLDRGDAAGRAEEARSRCGREHLSRFHDPAHLRPTRHPARSDDPSPRFRGIDQAALHRGSATHAVDRRRAEGVGAGTDLPAGRPAGLLELRRDACRLYRRARVGREIRGLYRASHLPAAWHDAFDLRPAAAEDSRGRYVERLRQGVRRSEEIRDGLDEPGRRAVDDRRRHREIHDRLSERWRADPQTRNREADAQRNLSAQSAAFRAWAWASITKTPTAM